MLHGVSGDWPSGLQGFGREAVVVYKFLLDTSVYQVFWLVATHHCQVLGVVLEIPMANNLWLLGYNKHIITVCIHASPMHCRNSLLMQSSCRMVSVDLM